MPRWQALPILWKPGKLCPNLNTTYDLSQPSNFEPDLSKLQETLRDSLDAAIAKANLDSPVNHIGVILFFCGVAIAVLGLVYQEVPQTWIPFFVKSRPADSVKEALTSTGLIVWYLGLILARSGNRVERIRNQDDVPRYRFGLCYAVVEELEKYETSGMESCRMKANQYLTAMLWYCRPLFSFSRALLDARSRSRTRDQNGKIDPLFWLTLHPGSEEIVDSLEQLQSKLTSNLRSNKDVPATLAVLRSLAGYLYSVIPGREYVDRVSVDVLEGYGRRCLLRASSILREMATVDEPKNPGFWQRVAPRIGGTLSYYSHPSAPARFLAWWLSTLLAVLLCLRVIQVVHPFTVDNAIVAVIVATPFTVAAAALAFVGKTKGAD